MAHSVTDDERLGFRLTIDDLNHPASTNKSWHDTCLSQPSIQAPHGSSHDSPLIRSDALTPSFLSPFSTNNHRTRLLGRRGSTDGLRMAPLLRGKAFIVASSLFLFLPSLLFLNQPTRIGEPVTYGGLRGLGLGGWGRRGTSDSNDDDDGRCGTTPRSNERRRTDLIGLPH